MIEVRGDDMSVVAGHPEEMEGSFDGEEDEEESEDDGSEDAEHDEIHEDVEEFRRSQRQ